jgi:hypothetical protein
MISKYLAASNSTSFLFSLLVALLLFASMQVFRTQIASSQPLTIAGGFLGSLVFISLLTVFEKKNDKIFFNKILFFVLRL